MGFNFSIESWFSNDDDDFSPLLTSPLKSPDFSNSLNEKIITNNDHQVQHIAYILLIN